MFTLITTFIAIFTALLTFILDLGELKGEDKFFLGLRLKTLKKISTYVTLVTTVLTLWLTIQHDKQAENEARIKEHHEDSLQTGRFDSTLREINKTLIKQDATLGKQNITLQKQDATLKSTDLILFGQKGELANQIDMLEKQRLALENYTNILSRQVQLGDSLSSSIGLMHTNLATQQQSLGVLNNTTTNLQTLNFPLSGMSAIVRLRLFVNGLSSVIKNNQNTSYQILSQNQQISEFVKGSIGAKLKSDSLVKYWNFFDFTNISWLERGFRIQFVRNGERGQVIYNNYKSINANGMFVSYSDVTYSPTENYVECEIELFCGAVFLNPGAIKNLYEILDSSKIQIIVRYPKSKRMSLPISNKQTRWVEIDHVELTEVKALKYGTALQYIKRPLYRKMEPDEDINLYQSAWGEHYTKNDGWRFAGIELTL